jgi:hypothetical protein
VHAGFGKRPGETDQPQGWHRAPGRLYHHGAWRTPSGQPTGRGRGIEIMQRLIPVVLIHHDRRGTRVLLSHPLPGPAAQIAAQPAEPAADLTAVDLAGGAGPGRPESHR